MDDSTIAMLADLIVSNYKDEFADYLKSLSNDEKKDQCNADKCDIYKGFNPALRLSAVAEANTNAAGMNNNVLSNNGMKDLCDTEKCDIYKGLNPALRLSAVAEANTDATGVNNNVLSNNGMKDLCDTEKCDIYKGLNQFLRLSAVAEANTDAAGMNVAEHNSTNQFSFRTASLDPVPESYASPEEVFINQPAFTSTVHIPNNTYNELPREPQFSLTPTQSNQEIYNQTNPASVRPVDVDTCREPLDPIEPTPGMTCAEYLSSFRTSPQYPEPSGFSPIYYRIDEDSLVSSSYVQSTPLQIALPSNELLGIVPSAVIALPSVTVPIAAAVSEQNDPPGNYRQIQKHYVLPSEGTVKIYPVVEMYQFDYQEPNIKKKPQKANIHYGTDLYCNECKKEFGKQGSLNQHMRQHHEEPRPFRCDTCGKAYQTEPDLRKHMENHDPTKKPWECSECDKRYRHMKDRDRHYDAHHGVKKHKCPVKGCKGAFVRRDHLLMHLGSHVKRKMREEKKAQAIGIKEGKVVKRGRKRK